MSDPDEVVPCGVCGYGEVNEPCLDYCHACERKVCDDCVAAINHEHGVKFCCECVEKGLVEIEEEGDADGD